MISEHKREREKSKRESITLNPKGLIGKKARMRILMDYRRIRISKNREKTIEKERRKQGLTKRNCTSPTQMVGLAQQTDQ